MPFSPNLLKLYSKLRNVTLTLGKNNSDIISCIFNILLIQRKESNSSSIPIVFGNFSSGKYIHIFSTKVGEVVSSVMRVVVLFCSVGIMYALWYIPYFNINYFHNSFQIFYFILQTTLWNRKRKHDIAHFANGEARLSKFLHGIPKIIWNRERPLKLMSLTSSLDLFPVSLAIYFWFCFNMKQTQITLFGQYKILSQTKMKSEENSDFITSSHFNLLSKATIINI